MSWCADLNGFFRNPYSDAYGHNPRWAVELQNVCKDFTITDTVPQRRGFVCRPAAPNKSDYVLWAYCSNSAA